LAVAEKISPPKIRRKKFGQSIIRRYGKIWPPSNFFRQFRRQVRLYIFSTAYTGFHQFHEFMTLALASKVFKLSENCKVVIHWLSVHHDLRQQRS
jgi:hypothetical protein